MLKRFVTMVVAALLLVIAAPASTSIAMGMVVVSKCPPPQLEFNAIQSGLWAGVNLEPDGLFTTHGTQVIVTQNGTICSTPDDLANPPVPNFTESVAAVNNSNSSTSSTTTTNSSTSMPTALTPAPTSIMTPDSSQSVVLPTTPPTTAGAYVAMGDSVAAGVGLPHPVSEPAGQTTCDRTAEAYPYMVALAQNKPVLNVACSGATVGDMFASSNGPFGNPSQLSLAFSSGVPKVISLTGGANDAHWSQLASDCIFSNCATTAETDRANADLVMLQKNLMGLMAAISAQSKNNPPEVIVTGYYNPISSACTSTSNNITPDEVNWMTGEVNALNETIQGVVGVNSFARFVPLNFSGHGICSSDPWVQGLGSPAPFHPTVQGQQVIASAVEAAM